MILLGWVSGELARGGVAVLCWVKKGSMRGGVALLGCVGRVVRLTSSRGIGVSGRRERGSTEPQKPPQPSASTLRPRMIHT